MLIQNLVTVRYETAMILWLSLMSDVAADIEKALTINHNGQEVEEWLELANGTLDSSLLVTVRLTSLSRLHLLLREVSHTSMS